MLHQNWNKNQILTQNKLSTRLPVLLAQKNAGNNLCKIRNKTIQIVLLCNNNTTKNYYFDLPKDVGKNLNCRSDFI